MPAFTSFFRPGASRSGVQLVTGAAAIGTGGLALTPTATVSVHVGIPRRKCKLLSLNLVAKTAAAGSAAITAQTIRRNNVGTPADVTLSAAQDLTATAITTADKAYNIPITATDSQTIFQSGDTLRIDVAAAGTVTTAPQVVIVAEWAVLA